MFANANIYLSCYLYVLQKKKKHRHMFTNVYIWMCSYIYVCIVEQNNRRMFKIAIVCLDLKTYELKALSTEAFANIQPAF
jgi:hypothetical protein